MGAVSVGRAVATGLVLTVAVACVEASDPGESREDPVRPVRLSLVSCGDETESVTPGDCYGAIPQRTRLARAGKTSLQISIWPSADGRTRDAAADLSDYLGRITGASFAVVETTAPRGIVLGTQSQWGDDVPGPGLPIATPPYDETHIIFSESSRLWLIGTTSWGAAQSVWSFLHHLGYRHFFPGEEWEIVPDQPTATVFLSRLHTPRLLTRDLYAGFGFWRPPEGNDPTQPRDRRCSPFWPTHRCDFETWRRHNQMAGPLDFSQAHIYPSIQEWWEERYAYEDTTGQSIPVAFPSELLASKPAASGGLEDSSQFCMTGSATRRVRDLNGAKHETVVRTFTVRDIVIEWAREQVAQHPDRFVIGVEPADGYGANAWLAGDCDDERVFDSISDRVVWLANEVAREFPDRFIALNAYSAHAPAPQRIDPEPNVGIGVATNFSAPGQNPLEIAQSWSAAGAELNGFFTYPVSIRDTRDVLRTFQPNGFFQQIRELNEYLESGARFVKAESGAGWAFVGLTNLAIARAGWLERGETLNSQRLLQDFAQRAFPQVGEVIARFYDRLFTEPTLSRDYVGRLYDLLAKAWPLASEEERQRLEKLGLYVRHVELYKHYWSQCFRSAARQSAFEEWMQYLYAIRHDQVVHTHGIWQSFAPTRGPRADGRVTVPPGARANCPNANLGCPGPNPWKAGARPIVDERFLLAGAARNPRRDHVPVSFSSTLQPANVPHPAGSDVLSRRREWPYRGDQTFFSWVSPRTASSMAGSSTTGSLAFTLTSGAVPALCRGNTGVEMLFQSSDGVTQDKRRFDGCNTNHSVVLPSRSTGFHLIHTEDFGQGVRLDWAPRADPDQRTRIVAGLGRSDATNAHFHNVWNGFFYVPQDATVVGGWSDKNLRLFAIYRDPVSGAWRRANFDSHLYSAAQCDLTNDAEVREHFTIPVPDDMPGTGQIWGFAQVASDRVVLETVPPYLARDVDEFLLPEDVVAADGL